MTQLSRPFQIALVAMGLAVAVWFVALRGHSSGASESTPAVSASSPATPAAGATSKVYHGSAPGIEGLTRDIAKAHGAVVESEKNAKKLEEKSSQASSSTPAQTAAGAPAAGAQSPSSTAPSHATTSPSATTPASKSHAAGTPAAATHAAATNPAGTRATTKQHAANAPATSRTGPSTIDAREALVEKELKQGDVVVLLFWNPHGAEDVAVHRELQLLVLAHRLIRPISKVPAVKKALKLSGLELGKKIVVQEAASSEVAAYGSITRTVQVSGTPTILIVNAHKQVKLLSGLTDAYSIEQAIDEARKS